MDKAWLGLIGLGLHQSLLVGVILFWKEHRYLRHLNGLNINLKRVPRNVGKLSSAEA